jgi:MFS transporter, DHA2 family, multidrug resistance protein
MSLHSSRLLDAFANRDSSILGTAAILTDRALAGAVRRQSSVLSYADVFYAMTAVAVITLFFVPLLPSLSAAAPPEKRTEEPAANPTPSHPLGATK